MVVREARLRPEGEVGRLDPDRRTSSGVEPSSSERSINERRSPGLAALRERLGVLELREESAICESLNIPANEAVSRGEGGALKRRLSLLDTLDRERRLPRVGLPTPSATDNAPRVC